jgi:formylglycine-generating enzyme required for sulfatase activity
MERLRGPLLLILQTVLKLKGDSTYVEDAAVAQQVSMDLDDVRDCFVALEEKGYVNGARTVNGRSAQITAEGRLALGQWEASPGEAGGLGSGRSDVKVRSNGLRSYDFRDADFFLQLLPGGGPNALPDKLRLWKSLVEERDAARTFKIGAVIGASGCGKSSLLKAGLLPRLASDILWVYVDMAEVDAETHLLTGLRKRCPDLPTTLALGESIVALPSRPELLSGKKVLIVLDQFEQWLSARQGDENRGVVDILRQCDGERVQALVTVRDDFGMALHRVFDDLGQKVREDENWFPIDLFTKQHAKRVLKAFGQASKEALPADEKQISKDQEEFLDGAIADLAERERVSPVRLAVFVSMLKGKEWTPKTLKEVGGAKGVVADFLEQRFNSQNTYPAHWKHRRSAQAVLWTLLPKTGSNIRGEMKSQQELLEASGYGSRPNAFTELLEILDNETRLITPSYAEENGKQDEERQPLPLSEKYYQLTHDYLVPSLRDWLTRKQKETRRGRAELLLADRAAVWDARPENRQLPSLLQWLQIRCLTARKNWTPPERKMMRRADRFHTLRGIVALLLFGFVSFGGWWAFGALEARARVENLLSAKTADVPAIIRGLKPYQRWAVPLLRERAAQADLDEGKRQRVALALLPVDAGKAVYLGEALLTAGGPEDVRAIRAVLHEHAPDSFVCFWPALTDDKAERSRRLRAAAALALSDSDDPRWVQVADDLVRWLAGENLLLLRDWAALLEPVRAQLVPHAARRLAEADAGGFAAYLALLRAYPEDAAAALSAQLDRSLPATAQQEDKEALARQHARAAVALLHLGRSERVWPLFHQPEDPTLRTYLIHRCAALGVDPTILADRLLADEEKDASVRQGLLLALGEYSADQRAELVRGPSVDRVATAYLEDTDPGIHSAAEWLLRRWQKTDRLTQLEKELTQASPRRQPGELTKPRWVVNGQGQTFAVIPAPGKFTIGSPPDEKGRSGDDEVRREEQIDYAFAVATKLVTVAEFKKCLPALQLGKPLQIGKQWSPGEDTPINAVSWYDAARYCNWLSEQEKVPKDQWCYEAKAKGEYAEDMKVKSNYRSLSGYRLPTEVEWEYACRAGTLTAWAHGSDVALLGYYAWYGRNSNSRMHPVGSLKPNALGLFDMHGNARQWCQDVFYGEKGNYDIKDVKSTTSRVLRGGSFGLDAGAVRTAFRDGKWPMTRYASYGFRVARTYR